MTQHRDIQGLLDLWLHEGSTVAPDRVIEVVADRIERQGQRGAWRYPRREFRMPALLRMAAVAAALAVVGAGAIYFAGSPKPSTTPPSPGPSATAVTATAPSPTPYVLPSGLPYQSPGVITWTGFQPAFSVEAPLGWTTGGTQIGFGMSLGLIHDDVYGDSGNVGGSLLIRPNPVLGSASSCPSERSAAPTLGPPTPASEMVATLLADPRFAVVAGPPTAVDGRAAQVLDIQLAPGFTGTCMGDGPSALLFDEPGAFVVLEGDQRVRLILLDVDDVAVLIRIWPQEETFDAFVARATGIIDSIRFLP